MNYMIHASPQRMWYVKKYLIPSMRSQGIPEQEIILRNDTDGKGNLYSCMESFRDCGAQPGGTWHLQDDVILSRDFAEKTQAHEDGIVCGFGCNNFGPSMQERGRVPVLFMWYSFQCIRIPNELAGECAEWFFSDAQYRTQYCSQVADRRHDDWFFREFMTEKHRDLRVTNLCPNVVDHIDYLIGGTLINQARRIQVNRAAFFPDQDLVEKLEEALNNR